MNIIKKKDKEMPFENEGKGRKKERKKERKKKR